jgi:hypothetical protein
LTSPSPGNITKIVWHESDDFKASSDVQDGSKFMIE